MTRTPHTASIRAVPKGGRPGPYQHLAGEFERRLASLRQAGEATDPRDAQIARLKAENTRLRERLAGQETTIAELNDFKTRAISRLAAQHAETERLRLHRRANVRELPLSTARTINFSQQPNSSE